MDKGNMAPRAHGTSLFLRVKWPSSPTMRAYGALGINLTPTVGAFNDLRSPNTLHSSHRRGALHSRRYSYHGVPPSSQLVEFPAGGKPCSPGHRSKFTRAIVVFGSGKTKYLGSLMPELISRISHGLRPSVLEGCEEQKGQYDDGDGPTGIPRKGHGFIISKKNEGEFVML